MAGARDAAECVGMRWHGVHKVQACRCTFHSRHSTRRSYLKALQKVNGAAHILGTFEALMSRAVRGESHKTHLLSRVKSFTTMCSCGPGPGGGSGCLQLQDSSAAAIPQPHGCSGDTSCQQSGVLWQGSNQALLGRNLRRSGICTGASTRAPPLLPCYITHASHCQMQVKYNIFERGVEKDGTLQACRDMGITVVAHSPLQQGLLTGLHCKKCMHGRHLHAWPSGVSTAFCSGREDASVHADTLDQY